jgi:16S rRNA (adenine(1408)-N(1))-methyltransferase
VLARARREPRSLVIGVDAAATAMAEASLRAARPVRKGGLPNALFVVAAVERPPAELAGVAAELTILFPWGSLLRGALAVGDGADGADGADAAAGIAALVAPGGLVRMLVSIAPRDHLAVPTITAADRSAIAERWACHGLTLAAFAPACRDEIEASGSSWSRRLGAGRERAVWRLELRRPAGPTT